MMSLGEQINTNGIKNGISILLFAGIVAQLPYTLSMLGQFWKLAGEGSTQFYFLVPLWFVIFVAIVWVITFMQDSERRIPYLVCKESCWQKDVWRSVKSPSNQVALGGVLPIIFARSILSYPGYY